MNEETVLEIEHYTDDLFWFKTTKGPEWEKKTSTGEFTMIGMPDADVTRAYSIANSPDDDYLEFLSIKVQDGPLTSKLQHIKVGDTVTVSHKAIGTLILRNLDPDPCIEGNGRLWFISTGTGLVLFQVLQDIQRYMNIMKKLLLLILVGSMMSLCSVTSLNNTEPVYQSVTRETPKQVYTQEELQTTYVTAACLKH